MMPRCRRTRSNPAHLADKDVPDLGQFIDLGLSEEFPKRQNSRVVLQCVLTRPDIGADLEHGRKFGDHERRDISTGIGSKRANRINSRKKSIFP